MLIKYLVAKNMQKFSKNNNQKSEKSMIRHTNSKYILSTNLKQNLKSKNKFAEL